MSGEAVLHSLPPPGPPGDELPGQSSRRACQGRLLTLLLAPGQQPRAATPSRRRRLDRRTRHGWSDGQGQEKHGVGCLWRPSPVAQDIWLLFACRQVVGAIAMILRARHAVRLFRDSIGAPHLVARDILHGALMLPRFQWRWKHTHTHYHYIYTNSNT